MYKKLFLLLALVVGVSGESLPNCMLCKTIVKGMNRLLEDNRTEANIELGLDKICKIVLPHGHKLDQCESMVKAYTKEITQLLIDETNPEMICMLLDQCAYEKEPFSVLQNKRKSNQEIMTNADQHSQVYPELKSENPNCMLCKAIVKDMFHFLKDNRTEAYIEEELTKICKVVFPTGQKLDQCESMVKAYTKEITQLLIDETDPEVICALLEQCTYVKSSSSIGQNIRKSNKDMTMRDLISRLDPEVKSSSLKACIECKLFIRYIRDAIDEPKSEEYVKNWLLKNLCAASIIPNEDLEDSCKDIVEKYSNVLFKAVVGKLDPRTACIELQVCRPRFPRILLIDNAAASPQTDMSPHDFIHMQMMAALRAPNNGQYVCDQCVNIVTQIDDYLSNHSIDKDVSILIDQVCNKMPEGFVRNECIRLVKSFGNEIAHAIATMDNPRQVCTKIELCQS